LRARGSGVLIINFAPFQGFLKFCRSSPYEAG
jgi:hypothetical protein